MNLSHTRISKLAAATLLALGSTTANASGFAIIEQSVTGLGNAFAGAAATAEDASTIFFNPAGLTEVKGVQYSLGVHLIRPSNNFKDGGSTSTLGGGASLNVNNEDGGDSGTLGVVPNFYYSRALDNNWTVGLGINAPFGLVTDYDDGWIGRYHGLTSDLKTININPTAAYKLSDTFSAGFGLNVQYAEAYLTSAIDYGGFIGFSQAFDGEAAVEGDDISMGYNFGFLWKVGSADPGDTRIGLAYRSRIKHNLEGEVDYKTPAAVAAVAAGLSHVDGSDVEADLELPANLSLSFHQKLSDKLALVGDVTWTDWSVFDELRVTYDSGAADTVNTVEWDDSNRYSLGLTYQYNDLWTLRTGIAYDESPIPDAEHRTPRIPGVDRTWIAFGFTYDNPKQSFVFDMGYAYLFVDDAEINLVDTGSPTDENFSRGTLVGEYEADVNILSAQARWLF